MKTIKALLLSITFLVIIKSYSQEENQWANPEQWTEHNCKALFDKDVIRVENTGGTAVLWLNEVNFGNGTVELDLKGNDKLSFLGLAFHGQENDHYDAVYFRPFNFRSKEKGENAIQYISAPKNDWKVLREQFPGKYESAINPVPDPNDWFHARIAIDFPRVEVFIDDAENPTLVVEKINNRREGKLGLWVDSDDGEFKNLHITNSN